MIIINGTWKEDTCLGAWAEARERKGGGVVHGHVYENRGTGLLDTKGGIMDRKDCLAVLRSKSPVYWHLVNQ
jgi:hypothetical protein